MFNFSADHSDKPSEDKKGKHYHIGSQELHQICDVVTIKFSHNEDKSIIVPQDLKNNGKSQNLSTMDHVFCFMMAEVSSF
jgi:hypothetical protein